MRDRKGSRPAAINRYTTSVFWTPERDKLLKRLEAAGARVERIAAKLGVIPRSVKRRSHYLRGLPFPDDWQREELRAKAARLREERERGGKGVLEAMRKAIARGTHRDAAMMKALARGAGPKAIAKELGVSRQLIYRRIWEGATEQDLRAIGERRKNAARRAAAAIREMRAAIARGAARETAIIKARNAGATYAAIGKAVGLTRQRVHQIILLGE
jgi:AraC-like DNA-binding protein